jgi:hypothetical protein
MSRMLVKASTPKTMSRKLRVLRDMLLVFIVGGILYTTIVASALVRNLRKEWRRKS